MDRELALIVAHSAPPTIARVSGGYEARTSWHRRWNGRLVLADGAAAGLTVLAALALVWVYVSNEHDFYTSDYLGYQTITHSIVVAYHQSPRAVAGALLDSMNGDYNAIFTIPLAPFVLLLGDSRVVFESALTVAYFLPFCGMLGLVATAIVRAPSRPVFWSAVALTLLAPMAWVPTLRGYPDAGGACLILLALWLSLRNLRDGRPQRLAPCVAIGFLLALAALFRRHFAYDLLAFLAAMALHGMIGLLRSRHQGWAPFWQQAVAAGAPVLAVAVTSGLTLAVVGHSFLYRSLTTNYSALYAAYMQPATVVVDWYAAAYGGVALALAGIGFAVGFGRRTIGCDAGRLVLLVGGFAFLEWAVVVRQTGEQYTLHFTPFVVLGLVVLLWSVKPRKAVVPALGLVLGVNCLVGLTPLALPGIGRSDSRWLAMRELPLTRTDQAEVASAVGYLRETVPPGAPIYVVASSAIVNRDLLASAEQMIYGWDNARLELLRVPQVDSRDAWPLPLLLESRYVVVARPFQHQLPAERQRVVKVVADLFDGDEEFADDFVRLPTTFALEAGTTLDVYQRERSTSLDVALRTLAFMEQSQPRPGGQGDWMVLEQPASSSTSEEHGAAVRFQGPSCPARAGNI